MGDKPSEDIKYKVNPARPFLLVGDDGSTWRRIKPVESPGGYMIVMIRLGGRGIGGKTVTARVHRVVLETFVGPCPEGMECRHLDGNPANNQLDNLRWGTPIENAEDKKRHGTLVVGSRTHNSILKEGDIPEVKRLSAEGTPRKVIAEKYGVSIWTIKSVIQGKNWRQVSVKSDES